MIWCILTDTVWSYVASSYIKSFLDFRL